MNCQIFHSFNFQLRRYIKVVFNNYLKQKKKNKRSVKIYQVFLLLGNFQMQIFNDSLSSVTHSQKKTEDKEK